MGDNERDYYQRLRQKINAWSDTDEGKSHKWAKWLLLAPDLFHLLIRLSVDPEVPLKEKAKLAAVIAYFISPIDLFPEMILGPTGFLDDIVLSAYVLNSIVNKTNGAIVQKHWAGEAEVLPIIQQILHYADNMLGSGLFKRVKRIIK